MSLSYVSQSNIGVLPHKNKLAALQEKLATLFSNFSVVGVGINSSSSAGTSHKIRSLFSKKRIGSYIFFLLVIGGVIFGIFAVISRAKSVSLAAPAFTKTADVNRDFEFPVYDKDKQLADPIKYTITTAQLTNRIIIKGQGATAASGRQFMILSLKLVNPSNKSLFLNTRNYVRIQPKGSEDKLAPEIHNDTVEIQPLSTKMTRIGLPVNESDREFTLFVGEINGEKQEVPVSF